MRWKEIIGPSVRHDPANLPDRAAVRRILSARPADQVPEYVRINVDLGRPVVLHAFGWAVHLRDLYPTLTVHGSNDPLFLQDHAVTVAARTDQGTYTLNTHALAHGAERLWQLHWRWPGSAFTPGEVAAGVAEVYHTHLTTEPVYQRLYADGRIETADADAALAAGHVWPSSSPATAVVGAAYRYYAFVVSVGRTTDPGLRNVLEVFQFQPIIEAPPAATLEAGAMVTLYGRSSSNGQQDGQPVVLDVTLSKDLVPLADGGPYGYAEVWTQFRSRPYFLQGKRWSPAAYNSQLRGSGLDRQQRALVTLPEVSVPRRTLLRSRNAPITSVPFVWCFLRSRTLEPVGEQAVVAPRLAPAPWASSSAASSPSSAWQPPPPWVDDRRTLRFVLNLGSARIPGESQFITLSSDTAVQALVTDALGSALPEVCLVLPTGEVLDFVMYDPATPLPMEVAHDEYADVRVTVRVQHTATPTSPTLEREAANVGAKRRRIQGPTTQ